MWIFIVIFTVVMACLTRRLLDPKRRILSRIPGPRGIPFLGNALQVDLANIHNHLLSWVETYGDVFKLDFAGEQVVVLNSYDAIHEALVTKTNEFAGRVTNTFRMDFTNLPGALVFRDFNDQFAAVKKTVHAGVKMYDDNRKKVVHRSSAEIQCCMKKFADYDGRPFDPNMDVYTTLINVMSELLASTRYEHDDPKLKDIIEYQRAISDTTSAGTGEELDMFPWLRFFGSKTFDKMKFFVKMRKHIIGEWIAEHKRTFNGDDLRDLTDALLKARKDGDDTFNDDTIMYLVDEMVGAGILTTHVVIIAFLQLMILHPNIQTRLQQEVDSVIGTSRSPTIEDRDAMPLLQANIHEILRYVSHVPVSVPHKTIVDTSVAGYDIPKSTQVWTNLFAMHHDENIFDEPWSYKPERWLNKTGEMLSVEERKKIFPFGTGRRVCVGEHFAKARIFLFLSNILQKFTVALPDDAAPPIVDPRHYKLGIVLTPPPFTIRTIPR